MSPFSNSPSATSQLYLSPVNEAFSNIENKLITRWDCGVSSDDVRYRLQGTSFSRTAHYYDVVLIDCPPRLTTGSVNALAASDFVLIPVLLEETSIEAVPRILKWLKRFQSEVCRELDVLGVVGNRAFPRNKLISRQQKLWKDLSDQSRDAWGNGVRLFDEIIREHANVDGRFAALDPKYEDRYHALVDEIRQEIPNACLQPSGVSWSLLPALKALLEFTPAEGNLTKVIEATADALAPFENLGLEQLSEVLRMAERYRETGELPQSLFEAKRSRKPRTTTPKAPKTPKPPKLSVEDALAKMEDLRARAQFFDLAHISGAVQTLDALSTATCRSSKSSSWGRAARKKSKPDRLKSIEDNSGTAKVRSGVETSNWNRAGSRK